MPLKNNIINSLYNQISRSSSNQTGILYNQRGPTGSIGIPGSIVIPGSIGIPGQPIKANHESNPIYSGSFDIKLIIDNTNYIEFYVNEIEFKSSNIEDTININLNIDELDIEKYNPNYIFKNITHVFQTIISNNKKKILSKYLIDVKFRECKIHWTKNSGGLLTINLVLDNIKSTKIEINNDIKSIIRDIKISKFL